MEFRNLWKNTSEEDRSQRISGRVDVVIAWSEDDAIVSGDQRVPGRLREIGMHTRDALRFQIDEDSFCKERQVEWINIYECIWWNIDWKTAIWRNLTRIIFVILSIRLSIRIRSDYTKIYEEIPSNFG